VFWPFLYNDPQNMSYPTKFFVIYNLALSTQVISDL